MAVVYIAGPMSGLPEFNYPAFYDAAARMRHALRMVVESDGIALLPGWEDSRGARLERQVADAIGLDVRPLAEWLADG